MKRISFAVMLCLLIGVVASCGNDSGENTEASKETVVVVTKDENKEEVLTEVAKEAETVLTDQVIAWTCEAAVTENEDATLTVEYILTDPESLEVHKFTESPFFDKGWYEMFTEAGGTLYELVDYNFDGHLDIRTQQNGAMVNQYYNIRLWNTLTGEFELDQSFMDMPNLSVNVDKQEIFSVNYDRGLGNYKLYTVRDGQVVLLAAINVDIKDDGSIVYTEIIGDGDPMPIKNVTEINAIWEGYKIEIIE